MKGLSLSQGIHVKYESPTSPISYILKKGQIFKVKVTRSKIMVRTKGLVTRNTHEI